MELKSREAILNVIEILSGQYLQGKVRAIRLALISLLSEGHLLLEDIPGLGKTSLALALSRMLGLSFGRIQCTSDLMPSDITGLSIFDRKENGFRFIKGPIFNNLILIDEINRAMPKTQSALLEAMEERRMTLDGETYRLPDPFLLIATQNPVEHVGTYPLPDSQLDRFLATTGLGYPPADLERSIIQGGSVRDRLEQITPSVSLDDIRQARQSVQQDVYLSEKIAGYIHDLALRSREHPMLVSGLSTRGCLSLAGAGRAVAYLEGRDYVVPEDIQQIAVHVCAHRLILRPENETVRKEEVFQSLLSEVPVPLV